MRFFHQIDGNVHELLDKGPFPYERELQEFFEKHLPTLTGIEFLASEYPTGPLHGRRIDTLGVDAAGRPVVIEYKRRRDENVINQGLDYLFWLEDHQAEFRELVRNQLGDGRVTDIDFRASRLMCIAEEFLRQDRIAAENSRRPIELVRYRRYGDAYVALEWVYGEAPEPASPPRIAPAPSEPASPPRIAPAPSEPAPPPRIAPAPSKRAVGEDPDFSIYEPWAKTNEETRNLFRDLAKLAKSLGSVRTDVFKSEMSFKCMAAPGARPPVVAYVHVRVRSGIRVHIHDKHLGSIPLEDGFTRLKRDGSREIIIRNREHVRRAAPLLRAAYDSLHKHGHSAARLDAQRKTAKRWRSR